MRETTEERNRDEGTKVCKKPRWENGNYHDKKNGKAISVRKKGEKPLTESPDEPTKTRRGPIIAGHA